MNRDAAEQLVPALEAAIGRLQALVQAQQAEIAEQRAGLASQATFIGNLLRTRPTAANRGGDGATELAIDRQIGLERRSHGSTA